MATTFTCFPLRSDVVGTLDRLNIRTSGGTTRNRLSVVMTGAGLSMAALRKSLTWDSLVARVAKNLRIDISHKNTRIDAMTVSWHGSRRQASAEESDFQKEVARCIKKARGKSPLNADVRQDFVAFLKSVHCDVVIDLNYDTVVEEMLDAAGISYYRIIGAQLDIHAPLPEGTIVLWKVHGSIHHPATIVLSPTEYQRIYEVNDLGTELSRLGASAHTIWSVGVGLHDDDVWTYLTSHARDLDIVCFWGTKADASRSAKVKLQAWRSILGAGVAQVTVLNAPYGENRLALRHALDYFVAETVQPPTTALNGKSSQLRATLDRFDKRWEMATRNATLGATTFAVEEFGQHYTDLVHFMLTRGKTRGSRWLPFLRMDKVASTDALAHEFHAVLLNCRDLVTKFATDSPTHSLLLRNAVQTVVRYVFDWLESFEIPHSVAPTATPRRVIQRGATLLVGANPFDVDVRPNASRFNLNHLFEVKNVPLNLGPPIVGMRPGKGASSTGLLTEDEWECAVRMLFTGSAPQLTLSGLEPIDLDWVSPVYPWGFGRRGLAKYRDASTGTVTKAWHLVSTRDATGRQICKGGSLRERGERGFMLGFRGSIRIGEFDDFVQRTMRIH